MNHQIAKINQYPAGTGCTFYAIGKDFGGMFCFFN